MNLFQLSQDVEQYVIDMRREFHANPEISFQEKRTTARIREELDKIGIPHETVGSGNVVALCDTWTAEVTPVSFTCPTAP